MSEEAFTPDRSREQLLAAISAAMAAAMGAAEGLRQEGAVEDAFRDGLHWDRETYVPLSGEVIER